MYTLQLPKLLIRAELARGEVASLSLGGKERALPSTPLFRLGLRDIAGTERVLSAHDACDFTPTSDGGVYGGFDGADSLRVTISLTAEGDTAAWRLAAEQTDKDTLIEWVDFPLITLPKLMENNPEGTGGRVLHPYNEGALVSDMVMRERTDFRHWDARYPSLGCYSVFPNMICSQMMAYLWEDCGLYVGAHDEKRSVKAIDYLEENGGITLQIRLYTGADYGEGYTPDFPVIWAATEGRWESAAERYRCWLEAHLPPRAAKIRDNETLPAWYKDSPLVVSYPVRGIHDTDDMSPNALYPYTNALPILEEIRRRTESRLMVLLMHWEGTAPWAPPYVWPPYGDGDSFNRFKDALHGAGDLLGVYCSGFGYTLQSNLTDYERAEDYAARGLEAGMCAGYDGLVAISKICTAQRKGYDICPASPVGRDLLDEAYAPLLDSDLDYAQILDQNHGGGQYFCHSRNHGHPPAPGGWMTASMQDLLGGWHRRFDRGCLGCESAAAEPFIGDLQFSDNRFELNYMIGRPVPLYAYLYHEYVRNFMGNQVCCNLCDDVDTLRYRLAYSFSIGDAMTLVLNPNGGILTHWGTRNFTNLPDKDKVLSLIGALTRFYREQAAPYLCDGRMIPTPALDVGEVVYHVLTFPGTKPLPLPAIHATAWEAADGSRALILVNPHEEERVCRMGDTDYAVPPMDARLIKL